jgi:gas vesicle protein
MLADASGIDCAFCLGQNKIFSLSLNQGNLYTLLKINIMDSGKIFLGVLAGLATGAVLGILLAPDKGSSTRHKMYKKGNDYVDGLGEKFSEFMDDVTKNFEKMKADAAQAAENGKAKVEEVKSNVANTVNKELHAAR